jgi:hypothetical protein
MVATKARTIPLKNDWLLPGRQNILLQLPITPCISQVKDLTCVFLFENEVKSEYSLMIVAAFVLIQDPVYMEIIKHCLLKGFFFDKHNIYTSCNCIKATMCFIFYFV